MARQLAVFCCVTLCALLGACSQIALNQENASSKGVITQYQQGSGLFNDARRRIFRGVASIPDAQTLKQSSELADARARAEVQGLIQDYFTAGSKHYIAAASRAGESVNDLSISHDIAQLTRNNAPGIRIIARWVDKRTAMHWSIAELDLQRLAANIDQSQDITPGFRTYLNQQHQILFDQLSGDKK